MFPWLKLNFIWKVYQIRININTNVIFVSKILAKRKCLILHNFLYSQYFSIESLKSEIKEIFRITRIFKYTFLLNSNIGHELNFVILLFQIYQKKKKRKNNSKNNKIILLLLYKSIYENLWKSITILTVDIYEGSIFENYCVLNYRMIIMKWYNIRKLSEITNYFHIYI